MHWLRQAHSKPGSASLTLRADDFQPRAGTAPAVYERLARADAIRRSARRPELQKQRRRADVVPYAEAVLDDDRISATALAAWARVRAWRSAAAHSVLPSTSSTQRAKSLR